MGQKVNPNGFRVGPNLIKGWHSLMYIKSKTGYANAVVQDIQIRNLVFKKCKTAQVSKVIIERQADKIIVNIHARRPGPIIGKAGSGINELKKVIQKIAIGNEIFININEVRRADSDAAIIAQGIATQIEKRISVKRAMKKAIQACMKQGAKGIKVHCSGRLGGAEIARAETYMEGRVPLHTLRANIDYATAEANTTYGVIGVKVWVYKGDIVEKKKRN